MIGRSAARFLALRPVHIREGLPRGCPKCGEPTRIPAFGFDQTIATVDRPELDQPAGQVSDRWV
ncbi:MAG: hypothetical protein IPK64_04085 [bacterium]|nr:hypothetical protein [bacterium]